MYDTFTQCVCAYYMCVCDQPTLTTTQAHFLQHQSPIRKNEEKIN